MKKLAELINLKNELGIKGKLQLDIQKVEAVISWKLKIMNG